MSDTTALGDRMKAYEAVHRAVLPRRTPAQCKRGQTTIRQTGERPVEYVDKRTGETVRTTAVRSWWETSPAAHFTTEPDGWLAETIPTLPMLGRSAA